MAKEGRPLKFKTVNDIKEKIDKYFKDCGEINRPLTITGLALALDTNRETLLRYENKNDEFYDTIKKAKLMCENFAEEKLFGNNVAGVIFNLKNNYRWVDENKVEVQGNVSNIKIDPKKLEAFNKLIDG